MAILSYEFKTINDNVVHTALASIERRVAQHNVRVRQALGGTSVARPMTTSTVAARAKGNADAAARAEQRAAEKANLYWQRAAQRSAEFRMRQDERAHQAKLRQINKEERTQASAAASLDRQRSRAIAAQFRAAERHAHQERRERFNVARGLMGTAGRSVMGTLGTVGAFGGAALGLAGTFAMGSAVQTQMAESARASQLANQAGKPQLKGDLLREAQATKGFTGMEALSGLGSFVDVTGDLETARKLLPDMSRVALATATDLGELGSAMGTAFIPLADAIKDPTERLKALNNVMKATAGMGAVGAVEVKDLAREMSGLAATSSKFAGDAQGNLNFMVAMAQATRQRGGASSAAEAVTSVERFGSDVITKKKDLKALGVDVFERDAAGVASKLKDPRQIMLDVLRATRGDISKIGNIFGERSIRAVQGFSPLFTAAEDANAKLPAAQRLKRGEAGTAAVQAEMDRLLKATKSDASIEEAVASRMSDPDMVIKENMKKFNAAVGSELLPVLTRLIPEFTKLVPHAAKVAELLGKLAEAVAKDPIGAILKLIAVKLALDIAAAGIGASVRNAITSAISGGGGAGVGGTVGGGVAGGGKFLGKPTAAGALGAAGIGAAIGTVVAAGISAGGIASIESNDADITAAGELQSRIQGLRGTTSVGDLRQGRDMLGQLEEMQRKAQKTSFFEDAMGLFGASNAEEKQKSIDTMVETARAALKQAETDFAKAGEIQKAAATEAGEAFKTAVADAAKSIPPHRGNDPSPVKNN